MKPTSKLNECYRAGGQREFDRNSQNPVVAIAWLRKSVSHCHDVNRVIIRETGQMQRELMNVKLRDRIIVAIVTAALTKAPDIYVWLHAMFR